MDECGGEATLKGAQLEAFVKKNPGAVAAIFTELYQISQYDRGCAAQELVSRNEIDRIQNPNLPKVSIIGNGDRSIVEIQAPNIHMRAPLFIERIKGGII